MKPRRSRTKDTVPLPVIVASIIGFGILAYHLGKENDANPPSVTYSPPVFLSETVEERPLGSATDEIMRDIERARQEAQHEELMSQLRIIEAQNDEIIHHQLMQQLQPSLPIVRPF